MDGISSIIGLLSLPARHKFYLLLSNILLGITLWVNVSFYIYKKLLISVIIGAVLEIALLAHISKWLVVYRKYSREGTIALVL